MRPTTVAPVFYSHHGRLAKIGEVRQLRDGRWAGTYNSSPSAPAYITAPRASSVLAKQDVQRLHACVAIGHATNALKRLEASRG